MTNRPHCCPYCTNFYTYSVNEFMQHMAEECPVNKQPATNLEQKMETENPPKPKFYSCPVCGYRITYSDRHQMVIDPLCPGCGLRYFSDFYPTEPDS